MARPRIQVFEVAPGTLPCSHCDGAGSFEYSLPPYGAQTTWRDCIVCDGRGIELCAVCLDPAAVIIASVGPRCLVCARELHAALGDQRLADWMQRP